MVHRTQLLLDRVDAFQRNGLWESALDLCEKVFKASWRGRHAEDLLEVVLRIGYLYIGKGDRTLASEQFELALTIAEGVNDGHRAGRALNGLGVLHQGMGDVDAAEHYFRLAKEQATASGDRLTGGDVEMNLGILANIRGDLREALESYQTAWKEYEAIGNNGRLAKISNNLGMLYTDLGQFQDAAKALESGLYLSRLVSDLATEGIIHTNRTELFLAIGRLEDARSSCDEAFEFASKLGDNTLKADVLKGYGVIYRETNKPHLAESHLLQAIKLSNEIGNPLLEAEATRELSLVFRSQDRNRESLEMLNRSHALFSALKAKQDQADIANRLAQLEIDFLTLVARWGESIEAKDRYTSGHCQRVADYACMIARAAGFSDSELIWFRMGAFLHDVGKTEIPEEILNKAGRLSDRERQIIEQHTIAGDEILSSIEFPWDIRPMVRSHHERWDGRGYPDGLIGVEIPYAARILKIADVFDALTTTRSYREPLTPENAFKLMESDEGSFDPILFDIFKELLSTLAAEIPNRC